MSAGLIILGLVILETHIVLLVLLYVSVSVLIQRHKAGYSLSMLLITIIEFIIWQMFMELKTELPNDFWDNGFSSEVQRLFLMQGLVTVVAAITTIFVSRKKQKHISKASIKEGMDTVPEGVLFYWPQGLVKLVNKEMDSLAEQITGEKIYNGADFWKKLSELDINRDGTDGKEKAKDGNDEAESALVKLPDGKLYSFRKNICRMNRHKLIEIIASDVSEEQLLHERLKEEQEKADKLNERLKTLNSTIEVMTAEKEILETKSMVHDEWGKTLLMSRRYLSVPDEELGHEILKQWKLNAMLLKDEEDLDINDDYSVVLKDIRTMGLETRIKGDLPQEDELKHLLVLTLRTCATNALRHGKGNRLNVMVKDTEDHYDIRVSNNGIVPHRPIEAGGGLTNLKKAIERIGGNLHAEYGEEFTVCVLLPKEGE